MTQVQAKLLAVIRDGMNDGYFSRETPDWGTVWSAGWCCIYAAWERHRWLCSPVSRHHRLLTGSLEVGTTLGDSEVKFQASVVRVGPALGSLWSPGLSSLATWLKDPCGGEGARRVRRLRLSEKRPCRGHTSLFARWNVCADGEPGPRK